MFNKSCFISFVLLVNVLESFDEFRQSYANAESNFEQNNIRENLIEKLDHFKLASLVISPGCSCK